MMTRSLTLLSAILLVASCAKSSKIDRSNPEYAKVDYEDAKTYFAPLPDKLVDPSNPVVAKKIALGKKLYFETALSQANDISCNSCHLLDNYGVDNEPTSLGHKGQRGDRNSPTVYNSGLNFVQFWDGRAKDLAEQAQGPVLNPVEMALVDGAEAVSRLKKINGYADMFKAAFPKAKSPITFENMADAIGAFEKNLLTPSRFDAYLKGQQDALSMDEKEGLRTFMEVGCVACHEGVNVGGSSYQVIGAVVPFDTEDMGRFVVTKDETEKFMFKVPTLRNVAKTYPYFHDGSVKSLEEAVTLMGKHQLGVDLNEGQVESIVAFLNSLTGDLPDISKM